MAHEKNPYIPEKFGNFSSLINRILMNFNELHWDMKIININQKIDFLLLNNA